MTLYLSSSSSSVESQRVCYSSVSSSVQPSSVQPSSVPSSSSSYQTRRNLLLATARPLLSRTSPHSTGTDPARTLTHPQRFSTTVTAASATARPRTDSPVRSRLRSARARAPRRDRRPRPPPLSPPSRSPRPPRGSPVRPEVSRGIPSSIVDAIAAETSSFACSFRVVPIPVVPPLLDCGLLSRPSVRPSRVSSASPSRRRRRARRRRLARSSRMRARARRIASRVVESDRRRRHVDRFARDRTHTNTWSADIARETDDDCDLYPTVRYVSAYYVTHFTIYMCVYVNVCMRSSIYRTINRATCISSSSHRIESSSSSSSVGGWR